MEDGSQLFAEILDILYHSQSSVNNSLLSCMLLCSKTLNILQKHVNLSFVLRIPFGKKPQILKLECILLSSLGPFPPNVKEVTFSPHFTLPLPLLPSSITHLTFGDRHSRYKQSLFNHPIDHLPPNLTHLMLSSEFNHPVDHLPPHLTHLTFGTKFNHPVDHLPESLLSLLFAPIKFSEESTLRNWPEYRNFVTPSPLAFFPRFNQPVDHLPPHLTHLALGHYFNCHIDYLPPLLTHLSLEAYFNKPVCHLPTTLTHLSIAPFQYDHLESFFYLPPTLTHLFIRIKEFFNITLPSTLKSLDITTAYNPTALPFLTQMTVHNHHGINFLPETLTHITFSDELDTQVDYLPHSATHLVFGYSFDQPVDFLPPSVTHIDIGYRFNHAVDNLPSSLISLKFGCSFNQLVDHLPPNLKVLHFGIEFAHTINFLPPFLTHLVFPHESRLNQLYYPICSLPKSITHLQFGTHVGSVPLPPNLQHLTLDAKFTSLPHSITHLSVGHLEATDYSLYHSERTIASFYYSPQSQLQLPPSLTHLRIPSVMQPLPRTLTHLHLNEGFFSPSFFPPSLTHLTLGEDFNKPLEFLPPALTHLFVGANFDHPLTHLPSHLSHLRLGTYFNQSISNLPQSITHLSFSLQSYFDQKIESLPTNIVQLVFGIPYNQPLPPLPPSLELIVVPTEFTHKPLESTAQWITFLHDTSPVYFFTRYQTLYQLVKSTSPDYY